MRAWFLVAGVASGACVSIPPYPSKNGVAFETDGTGGKITGPGFELHLAKTAYHYPDSFVVDGVQLIGHSTSDQCADEDQVGTAMYPLPAIRPDGVDHSTAGSLDAEGMPFPGPAVVQVEIGWSNQITCDAMREPSGVTKLTVFPDGRMVRYDTLRDDSQYSMDHPLAPGDCPCSGAQAGGPFVLTAFWAMPKPASPTPLFTGSTAMALPAAGASGDAATTACIDAGTVQLGATGIDRVRVPTTTGDTVAFVTDLGMHATLGTYVDSGFDEMWVGRTSCPDLLDHAGHGADMLMINQAPVQPGEHDGIYGGEGVNGGGFGIGAQSPAILRGPLALPFAVWLSWGAAVDSLTVDSDAGKTGDWYIPQRIDDHQWILWFRDPLASGEQITVTPR